MGLAAVALLSVSRGALSQACSGTNLSYLQTGDDGINYGTCQATGLRCQFPEFVSISYAFQTPGCNPLNTTCTMLATINLRYPGNHQNKQIGACFLAGPSTANVRLETISGVFISDCGYAGEAICDDLGFATVDTPVNCNNSMDSVDKSMQRCAKAGISMVVRKSSQPASTSS